MGGDAAITCQPELKANHQDNDAASNVTVTGTMTCSARIYNARQIQIYAISYLNADAAAQLGRDYTLIGQAQVLTSDLLDQGTTVSFILDASGRFFYQFSPYAQASLLSLIVGKTQADAQKILLQQPGIAAVSFTVSGGLGTALPGNAKAIEVRIAG